MKILLRFIPLFLLSGCADNYNASLQNPKINISPDSQSWSANYGGGASSKAIFLRTFKKGNETCNEYLNEIKGVDGEIKYFSTVCQEPNGRKYLSKKDPHYVKRY